MTADSLRNQQRHSRLLILHGFRCNENASLDIAFEGSNAFEAKNFRAGGMQGQLAGHSLSALYEQRFHHTESRPLMKRLFIGLLLLIFSVQGAIAALGGGAVLHEYEKTPSVCASLACADCSTIDAEEPDVFPVIEELSDYVSIDLPAPYAWHTAVVVSSLPVHLLSTDLPKLKPPPRS